MPDPKQSGFDMNPEYHEEQGVKFAYTGALYAPAPGEAERLAVELKEKRLTELHDEIRHTTILAAAEQKRRDGLRVRMNPLDALRLRAK